MKELSFSQQRLLEAITNCRIYQTRQLLETGTPAEFLDEQGYSPLLRACFIDDERHRTRSNLIKLLILYGADVNTTDLQGRHALTYACMSEKPDMVQLLLDTSIHNIDLNKKDCNGDTPLIHAVRLGNLQIVILLVDAMNKFRIDMDVRNKADRTPYLEAKHLGRTECAQILLEKANASRDVQVNPFLESIEGQEERKYGGGVRGFDWSEKNMKRATELKGDKTHYNLNHQDKDGKSRRTNSKRDIKILTDVKRLPKRQCTKPKGLKNTKTDTDKPVVIDSRLASNSTQKPCVRHVLREIQVCNEKDIIEPDDQILEKSTEVIKEEEMEKDSATSARYPPLPRVRPSTAVITRSELKQARNRENGNCLFHNTFLTDGTPLPAASQRMFVPRHPRSRTASSIRLQLAYNRQFSSLEARNQSLRSFSVDDNDDVSWYSHFSIHTSPSVNFMNKIMALYAEQVSPESSYRKGVKPRKSEYAPTIVAPHDAEHDKQSDGRRSSSGSVRSQSGSLRNRRFSAITKTVASYLSSRKAMTANKTKN